MSGKKTRRRVLQSMGASSIAALTLSGTAAASSDSEDTATISADSGMDSEIELARSVDWIAVSKNSSGDYELTFVEENAPTNWKEMYTDNSQTSLSTQEVVGPNSVTLGSDTTFNDMTIGDSSSDHSGDIVGQGGSSVDFANDRAQAAAIAAGGLGSIDQQAFVGVPFTIQGGGSQAAAVTLSGTYTGAFLISGAGDASIHITAYVENQSTGATYQTEIHSNTGLYADYNTVVDQSWSVTLDPTFYSGDTYRAYVLAHAHVSASGICDVSADYGPGDGDNGNGGQGVELDSVGIYF